MGSILDYQNAPPVPASGAAVPFNEPLWRRYTEQVAGIIPATAYAEDPFKQMVRHYDRAVVRKGGASIFTIRAYTVIF